MMEGVSAPAAALGAAVGHHPLAVPSGRTRRDGGAEGREIHSPTAAERDALRAGSGPVPAAFPSVPAASGPSAAGR